MSTVAIRARGLSKRYNVGRRKSYGRLTETLSGAISAPFRRRRSGATDTDTESSIWALKDVSLEVTEGEVIGIIGPNGAGKTTLLKILSRITEPTSGYAELSGAVGSLLEVGTGFHPELTGRENVYLSGSVIGMSRNQIRDNFDDIVSFAEVERFIDTPVKRYSAGMQVRLAFAVAAHLQPQILLVDEVLAVGDDAFQRKCLGSMNASANQGRTILFVSHNLAAIEELCHRCIHVDEGHVVAEGETRAVIENYLARNASPSLTWTRDAGDYAGPLSFRSISVGSRDGSESVLFAAAECVCVTVEYVIQKQLSSCQLGARLQDSLGNVVFTTTDSDVEHRVSKPRTPGEYETQFEIPPELLMPGRYTLLFSAHAPNQATYDLVEDAVTFEVGPAGSIAGLDGRLGVVAPILPWSTLKIG